MRPDEHHLVQAVTAAITGRGYTAGRDWLAPTAAELAVAVLVALRTRCRNCGHPISTAGTGVRPSWTHTGVWVGIRCPRRATVAGPMLAADVVGEFSDVTAPAAEPAHTACCSMNICVYDRDCPAYASCTELQGG